MLFSDGFLSLPPLPIPPSPWPVNEEDEASPLFPSPPTLPRPFSPRATAARRAEPRASDVFPKAAANRSVGIVGKLVDPTRARRSSTTSRDNSRSKTCKQSVGKASWEALPAEKGIQVWLVTPDTYKPESIMNWTIFGRRIPADRLKLRSYNLESTVNRTLSQPVWFKQSHMYIHTCMYIYNYIWKSEGGPAGLVCQRHNIRRKSMLARLKAGYVEHVWRANPSFATIKSCISIESSNNYSKDICKV